MEVSQIYEYIYVHMIYLSICLSIYLSIYLSVCLSIYLSTWCIWANHSLGSGQNSPCRALQADLRAELSSSGKPGYEWNIDAVVRNKANIL